MLEYLHVKNLALLKDIELNFSDHLNILSGETGAGKSILLGSISLALGCRADGDLIRTGADSAYVELIFFLEDEELKEKLRALSVIPEEDRIIISRKIAGGKSQSKINGETVPLTLLRSVSELLLDIHGQHEHQSLLHEENHRKVLDGYGREKLGPALRDYERIYHEYKKKKEEIRLLPGDDEERKRKIDFLDFQLREIEEGKLQPGEEKLLTEDYRRLSNSKELQKGIAEVYEEMSGEISDGIARSVQMLRSLTILDPGLQGILSELQEADSLFSDSARELNSRLLSMDTDEEKLHETEERLEKIDRLKRKYGETEEAVLKTYDRLSEEYETLKEFDRNKENVLRELTEQKKRLMEAASVLHGIRVQIASEFSERMTDSLKELNFLEVRFSVQVNLSNRYTVSGADECCFMISTNPGEPMKPISKVASGGELSRIMLAIKTLTTETDRIRTLIFDEIDAGISGRTGSAVAEKLHRIAENHQVFCISHLPQIVAMADHHFYIEKNIRDGETVTEIRELSEESSCRELARLLGTGEVTELNLQAARELKKSLKTDGDNL